MYTHTYTNDRILSILNSNHIQDENKKEAILTMGMSACQIGCMGGGQNLRFYKSSPKR